MLAAGATIFFALPTVLILTKAYHQKNEPTFFPITVNPTEETITEDPAVELMFSKQDSGLTAAVAMAGNVFDMLGAAIAATPLYESLAPTPSRLVIVNPGYRKEEVATAFAKALGWNKTIETSFLSAGGGTPALPDGTFFPDTYVIGSGATDAEARSLVSDRFREEILSHYATSTEAIVPLPQALTIASMIERETNNKTEMRVISGIIWNRIFSGMKLQIDATLQYAKAGLSLTGKNGWWPALASKDKFIKSPYNTYLNIGLPPSPISNPSVAAVLAALNPKNTSCLFYFHDRVGTFHCSDTYATHVALLKKYYGRGK
ncbi:endolytic transglycosylase MltG [Candidatus Kaiserbacteria bacterium]|nr:endolytic transglycosylase MltG [Candidatus Kaiserbacteria bacterium]